MNHRFSISSFSNQVLNGAGQIMLQENKWTGLFFIIGIFASSWKLGIACVVAIIIATLTATILKYNTKNIDAGLYGFNAALVGVAIIFLFDDSLFIWLLVVVASLVVTLLQQFFLTQKIPAYTFPFIVITWIIFFFLNHFLNIHSSEFLNEKYILTSFDKYLIGFRNFGQVIFQTNIIAGILFFVGVLISSPISALYGFITSVIASIFFNYIGFNIELVYIGLFGFNVVLTAIALSGNKKTNIIWVIIGTVITIIIHFALIKTNILDRVGGVLTFPFVAATWVTLLLQRFSKKGIS